MKLILSLTAAIVGSSIFLFGHPAAAQTRHATATSQAPAQTKSAPATIKQVLAAYDSGQFEQAMDLCKNVLTADPKNLTAHYVMGNICVKTNRTKDAIAQYTYCLQSEGAKTSPEAAYAKKALEQIKQQENAPAADHEGWGGHRGGGNHGAGNSGGNSGGNSAVRFGPMVGSTKSAEAYIQEQTDLLLKESREKLAVKQHTLDEKVGQIQEEIKQQMSNLPRLGGRRMAQQDAKSEAQDQIKEDGQRRIEQLKKDFQREADDLNQSYQNRISGLSDHYHNIESQTGSRSGSR
jgi:tetratricopeptide (TPR) repeat protein